MSFSNYLNFFMWAFNLKNSDVAKSLYVDPSLISKWRTGRRVPKSNMIQRIAEVLVSLCDTDAARIKLCNFLNIPYSSQLFVKNAQQVVHSLYAFMDPAAENISAASLQVSLSGGYMSEFSQGIQVLLGNEGFRKCMLGLLNEAVQRGAPFHVYLLTNDGVDWLLNEEAYFQKWGAVIQKARIAIASFRLIYHQSHNIEKGRNYVRAWSHFKYLPNFQLYNLAIRQDTHRMFNQTIMLIPHIGACVGINLNHSQNRYIAILQEENILQKMEHDFNFLLSRCIHTTEAQEIDYVQLIAKFQLDSTLRNCRDIEIYVEHLPIFTLPVETLQQMMERNGLSQERITACLNSHRIGQQLLMSFLKKQFNLEILVFFSNELVGNHLVGEMLPHSDMYFGRELIYTQEDATAHINATIELLQTQRCFHLYTVDHKLYPTDVFIAYNGFLMEYGCDGSNRVNFSYQQNYLNDVLSYISSAIRQQNHDRYTRESSIIYLKKLRGDKE